MTFDIDAPYYEDAEPYGDPTGVDQGPSGAFSDFILFGVHNGAFAKGPPDPSADVTPYAPNLTASNFMPNWKFIQSSNTNITAKQVRDTASPSGSNFRFTFAAGSANDEAYIEQIVDIGGDRDRTIGNVYTVSYFRSTGTASFQAWRESQYLRVDGTVTGSVQRLNATAAAAVNTGNGYPNVGLPAPSDAKFLRLRCGVARDAAATSATGSIDFVRVVLARGVYETLLVPDTTSTVGHGSIYQQDGVLAIHPERWANAADADSAVIIGGYSGGAGDGTAHLRLNALGLAPATPPANTHALYALTIIGNSFLYAKSETGATRLISGQLCMLPFVAANVPASATVDMDLSDIATGLATPRIDVPWSGRVVGVAARFSGNLTGGNAQFKPVVSGVVGGTVLTISSGTDRGNATVAVASATTFAAGGTLGLRIVTTAAFAPATLEVVGNLYYLLDYDGT